MEAAITNIENDRDVTRELLDDVMRYLSKNEQHHREVGSVAAKYVETLQRSNEQLVKIAALIQKKTKSEMETILKELEKIKGAKISGNI